MVEYSWNLLLVCSRLAKPPDDRHIERRRRVSRRRREAQATWPRPPARSCSHGAHLDATGPQLRALGNAHGEHAVLEVRVDLVRFKLIAQQEVPAIDGR